MPSLTVHIHAYVNHQQRSGRWGKKTAKTAAWNLAGLERSFGNRPVNQLGRGAIERWLASIGHYAPATRRNAIGHVRGFTRWLVNHDVIPNDPMADVQRVRQPRALPRALGDTDVAKILEVCPDQRGRVIVALMVGCGLRCVEVSRLGVMDWDQDAATLQVKGKGGHERILPVPRFVTAELDAYVQGRGPLIRQVRKPWRGLDAGTISIYVSAWFKQSGIKRGRYDGRSAHALRHTAASDVLDRCGDIRVVQEMLGHANVSTTSIYLRRANIVQMRAAMEGRDYEADASERLAA